MIRYTKYMLILALMLIPITAGILGYDLLALSRSTAQAQTPLPSTSLASTGPAIAHDLPQQAANTPTPTPSLQPSSLQVRPAMIHITPAPETVNQDKQLASTATTPTPKPALVTQTHRVAAKGPYRVSGNTILGADGKPYLFHGIARDGLEYNCWGDGHFDEQELAYMGPGKSTASATYWGANTVRLPLSEGIWLHGQSATNCSAASYHTVVKQTVDALTDLGLNVIIDLQWSDAGGQSLQGGGQWAMPDDDSIIFWQQVASLYKQYPNVLFELFGEPHPSSWPCWKGPCTITRDIVPSNDCHCMRTLSFHSVGMQALVDTVRRTGAQNLVLVGGLNWGYDLHLIDKFP